MFKILAGIFWLGLATYDSFFGHAADYSSNRMVMLLSSMLISAGIDEVKKDH